MAKFERQKKGQGIGGIEKALEIFRMETSVGWFPGAKYQDGTPVAYVATIQEHGSPKEGIPPRSFMRTTIEEKKSEWAKLSKSGAKAVMVGNASPKQVMEGIGLAAAGDIRKKITEITSPPLTDATVAAKKRKLAAGKEVGSLTKPLVETSLMLTSLNHEVKSK